MLSYVKMEQSPEIEETYIVNVTVKTAHGKNVQHSARFCFNSFLEGHNVFFL